MRKLYTTALIIAIILIIIAVTTVYYLSLPTSPPNILNEPQNQGNESQGSVGPLKLPNNQTNAQQNETDGGGTGGEGGNAGTNGSGGTTTNIVPKINYTLNINSKFADLDFIAVYYLGGILQNTTSKPPFSVSIDANTTACVGLISSYLGTFWNVDGTTYDKTPCAGYPNGCSIYMDTPHNVTLMQYS